MEQDKWITGPFNTEEDRKNCNIKFTKEHNRLIRRVFGIKASESVHSSSKVFCPLFEQKICLDCCIDLSYSNFDAEWSFCSNDLKIKYQRIIDTVGESFVYTMCNSKCQKNLGESVIVRFNKDTRQWYQVADSQTGGVIYSGGQFYEVDETIGHSASYCGELHDGKPTGLGVLMIQSYSWGETYIGEFKDGRFHGKGTLSWCGNSHSNKYKGQFKNGKRHGYGKQEGYGKIFKGSWENGCYEEKI
jgi:hypothetical protein